jgi:hypothetical protein
MILAIQHLVCLVSWDNFTLEYFDDIMIYELTTVEKTMIVAVCYTAVCKNSAEKNGRNLE